jgi:hypothetical protein
MKVISWNVRGLGRVDKRKEVRNLVREKNPLIVCLQETKLQVCDDSLCAAMWVSSLVGFSFRPSVGASGGLLTIWDTAEVEVWSSLSLAVIMSCGVMGVLSKRERNSWWPMFMHLATPSPGRGCGTRYL